MIPRLAFDTNAYRAWVDGNSKLAKYVTTAPQLGVPITVLGELYYGLLLGSQQERNLLDLNKFLGLPRVELLQIDHQTTKFFGEIAVSLRRSGRPIQQNDIWIAALCRQYDYTLATADQGFQAVVGLELLSF